MSQNQADKEFLHQITQKVAENISNEKFGVSELAAAIGMSRSNLLRKLNKLAGVSASQFIRQIRLEESMEMLKNSGMNVSEVAFEVGFGSVSYFIKCFREHYGYPPGEIGKQTQEPVSQEPEKKSRKKWVLSASAIIILIGAIILLIVFSNRTTEVTEQVIEKSIAVLPFINDSDDSSNVHIINGLMESILNNLQKIEDMKVVSRTSVEKYRNHSKTVPQMAEELNVCYFVEGSGQKIGDQILLNVQLIDAANDKHLWAEQYSRETSDIFKLQAEVAKKIAKEIQAIITPAEAKRIDEIPTQNIEAYEYVLKGLDVLYLGGADNLYAAIDFFQKAITTDPEYARPYAGIAIAYYMLDVTQVEKQFSEIINEYADKSLLLDPKIPQGLMAKAMYYMNTAEYKKAEPYLEKALEYNPNSVMVINFLSDFYTTYIPNTEKYLEYAIKGVRLDIASHDSIEASFIFLHMANAFIQNGFVDEAKQYIDKSLSYFPENIYSQYVKAYIVYAITRDLPQTKNMLVETLKMDTNRLDVLQEIGKICYYLRDYEESYYYYKKFIDLRKALNMQVYRHLHAEIAMVMNELGKKDEAKMYLDDYRDYLDNDQSIYHSAGMATYYAYIGEADKSIEQLKVFAQQENYHYLLKDRPLLLSIIIYCRNAEQKRKTIGLVIKWPTVIQVAGTYIFCTGR